jgi:hypothetical protein
MVIRYDAGTNMRSCTAITLLVTLQQLSPEHKRTATNSTATSTTATSPVARNSSFVGGTSGVPLGGYTSGSYTSGSFTPPWHASPDKAAAAARSRKNSAVGSSVQQLQLQTAARGSRVAGAYVTVNLATAQAVDTQKECPLEVTNTVLYDYTVY